MHFKRKCTIVVYTFKPKCVCCHACVSFAKVNACTVLCYCRQFLKSDYLKVHSIQYCILMLKTGF